MDKGRKIRNLVETDNISVCLEDIIGKAVGMTSNLINLEYGNVGTNYQEAWRSIREVEQLVSDFKKRLNREVFEEVHAYKQSNKHKYKGNADHLSKKSTTKESED